MLTSFRLKHITFAKKLMGPAWSLFMHKIHIYTGRVPLTRKKNIRWMHSKVHLLNCQANIFKFSLQILCNFFWVFITFNLDRWPLEANLLHDTFFIAELLNKGICQRQNLYICFLFFLFVCLHCRKKLWRENLSRKIKISARSRLIYIYAYKP